MTLPHVWRTGPQEKLLQTQNHPPAMGVFYFILFYFLFPPSSPSKNHILRCIVTKKMTPGPAQVTVPPGEKVWWGATNHEMMDGPAQRACGQRCWWVEGKSKLHRPPQLLKKPFIPWNSKIRNGKLLEKRVGGKRRRPKATLSKGTWPRRHCPIPPRVVLGSPRPEVQLVKVRNSEIPTQWR